MAYTIYRKDGVVRTSIKKLTYNGIFMDKKTISVSIESPMPIDFQIFDYIDYRGERFILDYQPTDKKQARRYSTGDAFIYDLVFVSSIYELERCQFRDLVPNDNKVHYATPLNITFTGDVTKLAERIQSCLDADYGVNTWRINVLATGDLEEKNIAISSANCWDALALVNTQYNLSYWVNKRTINIGGDIPAISTVFQYGKSKGLYDIKRNAQNDTGIVTRLIAFGSTRNIDASYNKKSEWPDSVVPSTQYLPNLMLSTYRTELKDYIDSDKVSEYGVRPATIIYDDIYPSIAGVSLPNIGRIDQIVSADKVTSDTQATFKIQIKDIGFDINDYLTNETAVVSIKSGVLAGYGFEIVQGGVVKNASGYQLTLNRNTTDNYTVPNVDLNLSAGDEFVLLNILMPKSYILNAENRLRERALEYLAQYDHTNFSYEINIEDQFLAENPSLYQSLFEGQRLKVSDEDLRIENEGVIIQSLTITEGENAIPSVKVVLDNNPAASTLNRIQGQVSELESTVINSFANISGATAQYHKKLDKAIFDKAFKLIEKENKLVEIQAQATLTSVGDVIAYQVGEHDIVLPQANYGVLGAVSVLPNSGIIINNGAISIDPEWKGGGVDFEPGNGLQLIGKVLSVKFGTEQNTVAQGDDARIINGAKAFDIISKGTWWGQNMLEDGVVTGALTGVTNINKKITITDTGVDVTGNLTATGDVVAYAAAPADISDWLGLVIDDVTIKINEEGKLYTDAGGGSIGGISVTGTGNAITGVVLSADKKTLSFSKDIVFALKSEIPTKVSQLTNDSQFLTAITSEMILAALGGTKNANTFLAGDGNFKTISYSQVSGVPTSLKNPTALSWSGYSSGSYDGSAAKSISIPNNTNQLTNGAGFISGITSSMILNALNGSGNASKYLAGNGTFYTIAYSEISGTPALNFLPLAGGTLTGALNIKYSQYSYVRCTNSSNNGWSQLSATDASGLSGVIQASSGFTIMAGNSYANRVDFKGGDLAATGDVVAYSTGSAPSPFKYWYPNVDTSGNISWINSTSETTPTTRNIRGPQGATGAKGATGDKGQGVSYQWSGSSLRLGTINSAGTTSWGSYVNLQGPTGPTGPQGATGPAGPTFNGGTIGNPLTITGTGNIVNFTGVTSGSGIRVVYNELRIFNNGDYSVQIWSNNKKCLQVGSAYMWAVVNWTIGSDIRFKAKTSDFKAVLDKIMMVDVFHYTRTDLNDGKTYTGVSAQQLETVFPEFVNYDKNSDRYGVTYDALGACVAIQGCKELNMEIDILKERIKELENKLNNKVA